MVKLPFKIDIGQIKVTIDRFRLYASYPTQLMIVYLFFDKIGWRWEYLILVIIFFGLSIWIDRKYIQPQEYAYIWKQNPAIRKQFTEVLEAIKQNGKIEE